MSSGNQVNYPGSTPEQPSGKPSMAEYSWRGFLAGDEVHAINFQKRRNYYCLETTRHKCYNNLIPQKATNCLLTRPQVGYRLMACTPTVLLSS